jgi:hypothetical protein
MLQFNYEMVTSLMTICCRCQFWNINCNNFHLLCTSNVNYLQLLLSKQQLVEYWWKSIINHVPCPPYSQYKCHSDCSTWYFDRSEHVISYHKTESKYSNPGNFNKKSLCYMNFNSLIIRHYSNLAPITSRKTAESHYFYWYIDHLRAIFLYVLFLIKPNILVLPQHRYSLRVNLLFDSWWWNCLFVAKLVGEKTEIRYH